MAKLQVYKFVTPGSSGAKDPVVTAARSQTLAFNRMGSTLTSIGNIVSDIEKIQIAQIKDLKKREQFERRRLRRERDAAAEELQEAPRATSKKKVNVGGALKRSAKKGLGWIDKFLGPIGNFLVKLGAFAIGIKVLEWVSNPDNISKLATFLERTKFVFDKIFGWAKGFTENILDGVSGLVDPNGDFGQKLGALGTLMKGIIGLKYLMNPFSLITDILGVIDILGKFNPRKPNTKLKKPTAKGTTLKPDGTSPRPVNVDVKPTSSFTGIENSGLNSAERRLADNVSKQHGAGARSVFDQRYNQMIADGASPSQAARRANADVAKLLEKGKLTSKPALGSLSTTANQAQGIQGSKIFKYGGKNIDKATQRFFLKVAGKGGVKSLKKLAKAIKVPVVGALITGIINWMAGDSVLDAVFKGLGLALGEFLGGWAGGAIGALGGPAAPITVPLGAFIGSVLGGIGGEALGGWLAGIVSGKGNPNGIELGAIGAKLKAVWDEKIMNGEFWAGAWEAFLNIGGKIMTDAWQAVNSMASFAMGKAKNFFDMLMEKSEPWRNAIVEAFNKYIINGPMELVKTIFDTIMAGVQGYGKLFAEGAPILLQIAKEGIQSGMKFMFDKIKSFFVDFDIRNPLTWGTPVRNLWNFISGGAASVTNLVKEAVDTVGTAVADKAAEAFAKAKEIGEMVIEPIMQYIQPALTAIDETWKIVSNLPGWVYNNSIKPIFDAVTGVFTSGPAIWEWLNRENTFQEITGQAVPEQEMFLGGVVKGIGKAVGGIGKTVGKIASNPLVQTAASFIPGAAPIMAGVNMATNLMQGNFNPMAMLGSVTGMFNLPPMMTNMMNNMSGVMNTVSSAMGGNFSPIINQVGSQAGFDPRTMKVIDNVTSKALGTGGLSAEYAMQQAMEFVPVPMVIEKIVPMPTAVPINTGAGVVTAAPSSLNQRLQ